jgi:hypothetical protein
MKPKPHTGFKNEQNKPPSTVNPSINSSKHPKTLVNPYTISQSDDIEATKNRNVITPNGTPLTKLPCVICGKPVFYTKTIQNNIVNICFASCKTTEKPLPKPTNKQTLEYINKLITQNNKLNSVTKASKILHL